MCMFIRKNCLFLFLIIEEFWNVIKLTILCFIDLGQPTLNVPIVVLIRVIWGIRKSSCIFRGR